ncbi:MAG TPA: TonB-dependent receptor [Chitinophagales bacterium]|nr:TonB-dependent receptor [Chitinophagales bacterium]HRG84621.1 TonB-dependent receptor [Chitinophagales bacterium]HRH53841.1 TonB-dependent receptor [Chitinophagales bacterium]
MRKYLLLIMISFVSMQLFGQGRTITGKITDADNGEYMPGVTILLEGTQNGTISDFDGKYNINVPESGGTLVFSFVGYETQKITLGEKNVVYVSLKMSQEILEEVVVVGYGTEVKTKVTGSISEIKSDEIALTPVSTVEQTLQGRAAGLFIESNNGKVGGDVKIRIRGSSSINASNQPLIIVDGIPINTVAINDYFNVYLNPLNDLDFNDIASVEVLKDASASAIYGSRAANGVLIITTKRGKEGKAKITLDYQQGYSEPTRLREFLNAEEYIDYFTQAAINAGEYDFANGLSGYATVEEAVEDYIGDVEKKFDRLAGHTDWRTDYANTDWQSLAFQKAISSMLDLSISGGTEKMQYFTSVGYSYQDGIMLGNHGDRFNILNNIDAQLTEKLKMSLNLNLSRSINNDIPDDNSFSTPLQMVAQAPITPPADTTGEYYNTPTTLYYNPLIEKDNVFFESTTFRTLSNIAAEYQLIPSLAIRGEFGGDITNHYQERFYGSKSEVGLSVGGYATNYNATVQYLNTKLLLLFDKQIEKHSIGATGGMEYNRYDDNYNYVEGQGFPNDKLQTLASAAEIVAGTSVDSYYRFLSYFARATYDYDTRYLLNITVRADGSSRFGEENRYGVFPSASVGWVMSNEAFLKGSKKVSLLKLRASYGLTGNAGIGNFDYKGLYGIGSYAGTSSIYPSTIANPALTWEKTAQLDIGFDFGFYNDRISGELDYYIKNTTDLLLDVPVPATTGYALQTQNVGSLENKGYEIVINTQNFVGDFSWSTSFNFSVNKNKILELAEGQELIDLGGSDFMNVIMIGQPLGVFYGAEYAGVDPDNGDGLFYVNETEGSDETTTDFNLANYVVIGDPNPDFISGITNNFAYKNISLDVTLQSVYGNDVNLQGDYWMSSNASQYDNQTIDQLDAWQNPGDETDIPENRLLFANGTEARSSRYLSDASYLRVKTVTLSFTFPKRLTEKMNMSSLRLYTSAYNLFTFTNYTGWDPEVSTDSFTDNVYYGLDFYSAPQPKTVVFGVSIAL